MNRTVVYQTSARDPVTELPIVIVDTTALGTPDVVPSLDMDMPAYLQAMPQQVDFELVFLTSRAPKMPHIAWLHKLHALLDRDLKKRIKRVFLVHANWYTRALNRAIAPIVSPKFAKKLVHAKNLSELSKHIDITAIDFSPKVFLDDTEFNDDDEIGLIRIPKHCAGFFGERLPLKPSNYWCSAVAFLNMGNISEEVFIPISRSSQQEKDMVSVLKHAVKREQRLKLSDYGPHVVLCVLKEYMVTLPVPIVDIRTIPLPVTASQEYIDRCLSRLSTAAVTHLKDIIQWLQTLSHINVELLGKSLGPSLMGMKRVSREEFSIAARFVILLVTYWDLTDLNSLNRANEQEELADQRRKLLDPHMNQSVPAVSGQHPHMPQDPQSYRLLGSVPNLEEAGRTSNPSLIYSQKPRIPSVPVALALGDSDVLHTPDNQNAPLPPAPRNKTLKTQDSKALSRKASNSTIPSPAFDNPADETAFNMRDIKNALSDSSSNSSSSSSKGNKENKNDDSMHNTQHLDPKDLLQRVNIVRPRDLPSEIKHNIRQEPRVPNKRAFGKIAEIIKVYDESSWV